MLCWCGPALTANPDHTPVCAKDVGMLTLLAGSAKLRMLC